LRKSRGMEDHGGLKHAPERVLAEVGQLGIGVREAVVRGPRACVSVELGHRAGKNEADAPSRCQQAGNAAFDEEGLKVTIAAERPVERHEVAPKALIKRLCRSTGIRDPRRVAHDRAEASSHADPPRVVAPGPSLNTSGNSISQWNGRIPFGPSRKS